MKNLTTIILDEPGITDFAVARNRELENAKSEWVLFVDKDEKVTDSLKNEIEHAIESNKYDAYYLHRDDYFLGRKLQYGETGNIKLIRLARRSFGHWVRPVHEVWSGKGRIGEITAPLEHRSHPGITSFLDKINIYSDIEAAYRYRRGIKSSFLHIVVYPVGKFIFNYFVKRGYLDGVPGIIMAMMMSFHSYLTWTKLYLLWHKK